MTASPAIRTYLREIAVYPLLTADDEVALAERIACGCERARELLIQSNLRLVVKLAGGYSIPTLDPLDLINEGNIGLMKAVERFDPKKGCRFSTCAAPIIHEAIKFAITNQGKTIRLPSDVSKKILGATMVSMDEPKLSEDGKEPRQFADENNRHASILADHNSRVAALKKALAKLSKRERIIMLRRYDLPIQEYANA